MISWFISPDPGGRTKSPEIKELGDLFARMRQILYPETLPVLISYWLKAVYSRGHEFRWWKKLRDELTTSLSEQFSNDDRFRQALTELDAWIRDSVLLPGHAPPSSARRSAPVRTIVDPEELKPYVTRLLNEWLPREVAGMLVHEGESPFWQGDGIPALASAVALERLLVRERLSPETLEKFLDPQLVSPQSVYPADAEILRYVVLALLGRTSAPAPPVMPAMLLCNGQWSPLPADYGEAVRYAIPMPGPAGDQLHVPLAPAQLSPMLKNTPVLIGSIVVTMDGRWWESQRLSYGQNNAVVYFPMGRLKIDFSADHARMRVPWPEARAQWCGNVEFPGAFELFGREWRVSRWEQDAHRTWLDLVFSDFLPVTGEAAARELRRSRPASVDIAWSALENALADSILQNNREPIEQLRHSELIPLGRALLELSKSITGFFRAREGIETRLNAVRYLQAPLVGEYGRVPWRIVPGRVRAALLHRGRSDPALRALTDQVFEGSGEIGGAETKLAALGRYQRGLPRVSPAFSPPAYYASARTESRSRSR
ncbi:MAG TPA: hypothetical protein VH640_04075 [Bryobacteraceae bacterium]|jgi:hypothetical protein